MVSVPVNAAVALRHVDAPEQLVEDERHYPTVHAARWTRIRCAEDQPAPHTVAVEVQSHRRRDGVERADDRTVGKVRTRRGRRPRDRTWGCGRRRNAIAWLGRRSGTDATAGPRRGMRSDSRARTSRGDAGASHRRVSSISARNACTVDASSAGTGSAVVAVGAIASAAGQAGLEASGEPSAVDDQLGAGDVGGLVADQEQHGCARSRSGRRCGRSPGTCTGGRPSRARLRRVAHHRVHAARVHRVDPNAEATPLDGGGLGHAPDGELRRRVRDEPVLRAAMPSIDEMFTIAPPPMSRIGPIAGLHAEEAADLVDVDDATCSRRASVSSIAAGRMIAALLTSASSRPPRSTRGGDRARPVGFVAHVEVHVGAPAPMLGRDRLAPRRRARRRAPPWRPRAANIRASASPWPRAAPVTITTLPSNRPIRLPPSVVCVGGLTTGAAAYGSGPGHDIRCLGLASSGRGAVGRQRGGTRERGHRWSIGHRRGRGGPVAGRDPDRRPRRWPGPL